MPSTHDGYLDTERETTLDEVLAALERPCQPLSAGMATEEPTEVIDLTMNGVRMTVMPTASSHAERSPDRQEADVFLELAEQVFNRFRPDVLQTYGGQPASLKPRRMIAEERLGAFHRRVSGAGTSCPFPARRKWPERSDEGRVAGRVEQSVPVITVSNRSFGV